MMVDQPVVVGEIVAKRKGCMLCDLAIGILEEIAQVLNKDVLQWDVVDVSDAQGLRRYDELTRLCGCRPAVPSIVIDAAIAFDHIPDMHALTEAVQQVLRHPQP